MRIRTAITYDMPMSLQQCCLDSICNNLDVLCQAIQQPHSINVKLAFKNSDVFFNDKISEEFLKTLCEKGKLNDETLSLFDPNLMNLKRVRIEDAQLSPLGLKILKTQKISDLEISGLRNVTVNDVIGSLGKWTLSNLRTLHVSNLKSIHDPKKFGVLNCLNTTDVSVNISSLRKLQYLNVSNTEFNMHGLEIIAEELPCLEILDISCTQISDISPLRKCKDRLKCLSMYQVKIYADIVPVLSELTELVHLDVSYDSYPNIQSGINFDRFKFKVSDLLSRTHCLPNLSSLDISGNEGLKEPLLMEFLKSHSGIRFLGLALTPACRYSLFLGDKESEFKANITVTGEANERQILECLRRYANRPTYVQHALCTLFTFTRAMSEPREDILKLVLLAIKRNPNHIGVQEAAVSCLFNLLKSEVGPNVHPSCLKDIVNHTLLAMANFPRHQQIQNRAVFTLYTLCNKGILEDISQSVDKCGQSGYLVHQHNMFVLYKVPTTDGYRICCVWFEKRSSSSESRGYRGILWQWDRICDINNAATLIMECLCSFDVPAMIFRCVTMFALLTAQISTDLGANPRYMKKVLQLVEHSIANEQIEAVLDAVLRALGNLTAYSPVACQVFVDEEGLELFMRMFEAATKLISCGRIIAEHLLLETLYNIVQVEELHPSLMRTDLLLLLKNFMHAQPIFVRFMAAAIIAHLASDEENRQLIGEAETHILDDLKHLVLSWEQPEEQIIDCSSFKHFFPLLNCIDTPAVQLWALWSIQHVCIQNGQLYCRMLEEEGGTTLLNKLVEDSQTNDDVVRIIKAILQLVEQNIQ